MKLFASSLLLVCSLNLYAQTNNLGEFFKYFKDGNYPKAVEILNSVPEGESNKSYLLGLTYARMQEYDKAQIYLTKAIEEKNNAQDLYYEYGQTLYANNELKKARDAFKQSAKNNYNKMQSLYYVGHISQILEDHNQAKSAYIEILKNKDIDPKIEQVARFQLAETGLNILRDQNTKKVQTEKLKSDVNIKIVPMLKKALEVDKGSTVAFDIDKRIKEIIKEFDLDPDLMKNGRRINSKRFNAYVDLKTKFDDNVTNSNFENDTTASHKESFYAEFETDFKYDFSFFKRWIVSPELRFNFNKYANQTDSDVFQNDAHSFTTTVGNKFEHLVRNAPASFIFNFEYSKNYKDYNKVHKKEFYANSTLFTIGEQFTYFNFGDTTFKFKYKNYDAYSDTLNNHTKTVSADQTIIFNNQLLIVLLEADFIDNYNNTSNSTDTYMLRFDYIIPEIFPKYSLTTSLAYTLTDTKKSMATRGHESLINPSFEISKDVTDRLKAILSIDYSNSKSKSSDYNYQKYVTNFELKYSF